MGKETCDEKMVLMEDGNLEKRGLIRHEDEEGCLSISRTVGMLQSEYNFEATSLRRVVCWAVVKYINSASAGWLNLNR